VGDGAGKKAEGRKVLMAKGFSLCSNGRSCHAGGQEKGEEWGWGGIASNSIHWVEGKRGRREGDRP